HRQFTPHDRADRAEARHPRHRTELEHGAAPRRAGRGLMPEAMPAHTLRTVAWIVSVYLLIWGLALVLSRTRRREMAARFLLTSASLALTVGVLELLAAVNLVDYRLVLGVPITEPWRHPHNRLDARLLHIHEPY